MWMFWYGDVACLVTQSTVADYPSTSLLKQTKEQNSIDFYEQVDRKNIKYFSVRE
jgi:hypothetical protein